MKKKFQFVAGAALCAALAFAQGPGPRRAGFGAGRPAGPGGPVDALKTALGLSDDDVTRLRNLTQTHRQEIGTVATQLRDAQKALNAAEQASSPDPATVGRLALDAKTLREQLKQSNDSFHTQLVNSLSADQRAKLKTLEDAAALMPAVHEAAGFGLLSPRDDFGPGMGPMGAPRGGGPGPARFRRPPQ